MTDRDKVSFLRENFLKSLASRLKYFVPHVDQEPIQIGKAALFWSASKEMVEIYCSVSDAAHERSIKYTTQTFSEVYRYVGKYLYTNDIPFNSFEKPLSVRIRPGIAFKLAIKRSFSRLIKDDLTFCNDTPHQQLFVTKVGLKM